MTNDEIIAEFNEAATLAALMELSNEIAALSLDLGVELPEDLLASVNIDDCDSADYTDGLSEIVQHVRDQIGERGDGDD